MLLTEGKTFSRKLSAQAGWFVQKQVGSCDAFTRELRWIDTNRGADTRHSVYKGFKGVSDFRKGTLDIEQKGKQILIKASERTASESEEALLIGCRVSS